MALETNAQLLGRVPIFQGLSPERLAIIADHGREIHLEQGRTLLCRGECGQGAFLILSGSVAVQPSEDSSYPPEVLGHGTFLGELAMLVETTFTVTVMTRWPVQALFLERATMFALMEDDPAIAHHFSEKLLERLRLLATNLRRVDGKFAMLELSLDQAIASAG
jgi:CRP-like cAMP-binding protein